MHNLRILFNTVIFLCTTATSIAEVIAVKSPSGETFMCEVNPEESFMKVMQEIETQIGNPELGVEYTCVVDFTAQTAPVKNGRDYFRPVSSAEMKDINYIVKTLASSSWTKLWSSKSSLKEAGDRIENIHPLRFLLCIFMDEELKGGIHAIRDRKKIWKEFFSGLSDSLEKESNIGNLQSYYIQDFANTVKIDAAQIRSPIQQHKWTDLLDLLIALIPRQGNPGRYDM